MNKEYKIYRFHTLFFFFYFILALSLKTQAQSFVKYNNMNSLELSASEISALQKTCDLLIKALPVKFQNDFKVYFGGFYLPLYYQSEFPEGFDKMVKKISHLSKYYMVIGIGIMEKDSSQKRAYVMIKFPGGSQFSCKTEAYYTMLNAEINYVFDENTTKQLSYFSPIQKTVLALKEKVLEIFEECRTRFGSYNCISNDMINKYFTLHEFYGGKFEYAGEDNEKPLPEIKDYAHMKIKAMNNEVISWKHGYNEYISLGFQKRSDYRIFLTTNFCKNDEHKQFEKIRKTFENQKNAYMIWIHFQRKDEIQVVTYIKLKRIF